MKDWYNRVNVQIVYLRIVHWLIKLFIRLIVREISKYELVHNDEYVGNYQNRGDRRAAAAKDCAMEIFAHIGHLRRNSEAVFVFNVLLHFKNIRYSIYN